MMNALAVGAAAYAHIARFAAAYPCLNRGADFRFLANNRRANPRSTGYGIRAGRGGIGLRPGEDGPRFLDPTELSRLSRPIEHAVDLARHDEVVLVQSLDLLGGERHARVTPAEADIGVMTFGLGELPDPLHEAECFPEIAESKRALDAVGVVA